MPRFAAIPRHRFNASILITATSAVLGFCYLLSVACGGDPAPIMPTGGSDPDAGISGSQTTPPTGSPDAAPSAQDPLCAQLDQACRDGNTDACTVLAAQCQGGQAKQPPSADGGPGPGDPPRGPGDAGPGGWQGRDFRFGFDFRLPGGPDGGAWGPGQLCDRMQQACKAGQQWACQVVAQLCADGGAGN